MDGLICQERGDVTLALAPGPTPKLCLVGAWPACLELAVLAFENVPVWTRVAHVAVP